ncbi:MULTISPECIES: universal stress protein [Agrobacterium]|uniref:universal stress protein n=1 Tax=Agrobacterium TaxID=357 RepID=UPI00051415FE|nr:MULTISPECIES: universal stress protein [Agrobacterium]ANV25367.1 hypothetical protein BA939_14940 [Rhizobium sp. S41]KGE80449.1 hypothetical protein LW14_23095 [Rhizobium sp. H41]MCD4659975.1 universal stress protein [Agrobacterium sp.]OJH52327.1 hypothetical protein ATN81_24435 [Agrobacterium pusense]OJH56944.1 hypothetical protein BA725_24785 [Agrobacterium pusense]
MRTPKDIVVYIDTVDASICRVHIDYAVNLARSWGAHVVVAFAPEELAANPHSGFARGAAIESMLAAYRSRQHEAEENLRATLSEVAAATGVICELRICSGESGETLMLHARHTSLAIVGTSRQADRAMTALTVSEDIIFASGRPSILLPPSWRNDDGVPKTIVIGWNASREATRAIGDAMPFLTSASTVHVVVVPEPKVARLLGEDPGADISSHLARHGIKVVLDRLEGDNAGDLIVARAEDVGAEMVVMGAYGQSRITEFVFGSATRTLLANPKVPILLSR